MPETFERRLQDEKFVGKPVTETQWYRPWPPAKKITWSLRDNTNYMEAGVLEALEYASLHREELLRNFWVKGNRAIERGKSEPPYAWIFPLRQRDPSRLAYLVNQLRRHRIELHRLQDAFATGDTSFAAGSFVVRMDQPYRNEAIDFLETQNFPGDEPNPPYDDVAWTWPLLYGVDGTKIDDAKILDAPVTAVEDSVDHQGTVSSQGPVFLLADTGQTSFMAARVRLARFSVEAAETAFAAEVGNPARTGTFPAGSWIVRAPFGEVEKAARELGLDFEGTAEVPQVPRHPLDLPRLAVMHTWISTQDCGWVR
jgi:hypothetical protein